MTRVFLLVFLFTAFGCHLFAQTEDSTMNFNKYDWLPAISYAPESQLIIGGLGYRYFKSSAPDIPNSFINFSGVYTTVGQLYIDAGMQFFLPEKNRLSGNIFFYNAPDRIYGLGNSAKLEVEFQSSGQFEKTNYLMINSIRYGLNLNRLYALTDHLFIGPGFSFENVIKTDTIPDNYQILTNPEKLTAFDDQVVGKRFGTGFNITYDKRDNVINPWKGIILTLDQMYYLRTILSDYSYFTTQVEFRSYSKIINNQVFAFKVRNRLAYKLGNSNSAAIPYYDLSRTSIRGYISGTYIDNHIFESEIEYRIPFWNPEKLNYPWYKFWKSLGMTVFAGAGEAHGRSGGLGLKKLNYSAGAGVRILFNKENKLNLRIDYAIGLDPDSAGNGKRQTGFYFNLSEAF